jgi:hypothetical protein
VTNEKECFLPPAVALLADNILSPCCSFLMTHFGLTAA